MILRREGLSGGRHSRTPRRYGQRRVRGTRDAAFNQSLLFQSRTTAPTARAGAFHAPRADGAHGTEPQRRRRELGVDQYEVFTNRLHIRLIEPADAAELLRFKADHLTFFQPWWPAQDLGQYTVHGQRTLIDQQRANAAADRGYAFVMVIEGPSRVIGTVNLNNVVRGAFQSADLGYALAPEWNGRGLMTEGVRGVLQVAFGALQLHRVQAAVMPRNRASHRVLVKNRFEDIGYASRYLKIAGQWEDHVLYQRLAPL